MGGDFEYSDARWRFMSIDRLIEYFNAKYDDMHMMYSTPSRYLEAMVA